MHIIKPVPIMRTKETPTEEGFTLKEVVITVAIVLIISLVGFFSYQGFTDNAKRSAVERAANEVFTVAVSEDMLPNGRSMQAVEDDFNESSEDPIRVEVEKDEATRDITVTAYGWEDEDPPYIAVRSTDITLDGSEGTPGDSEEEEDTSFTGDINDYDDGVFTFETEATDSKLYLVGLSDNFSVRSGDTIYTLDDMGIDSRGGVVTFPGSGEFTMHGGFEVVAGTIMYALDLVVQEHLGYSYEELLSSALDGTLSDEDKQKIAHPDFQNEIAAVQDEFSDAEMNSPFRMPSNVTAWSDTGTRTIESMFAESQVESVVSPPSTVQNMGRLFENSTFNGDITNWNVENVTQMAQMFRNNPVFNQDIGSWDVSSAIHMFGMFANATSFDQDLSQWDMRNVKNIGQSFGQNGYLVDGGMFAGATAFNNGGKPLLWKTPNLEDMTEVFSGATSFNQDISSWDVSNVESMQEAFKGAESFNQDLSNWKLSSQAMVNYMFSGAANYNNGGKALTWDTSEAENLSRLFSGATAFNQDVSSWDVSRVEFMSSMFNRAISFNQDVSSWDISSVTSTSHMFNNASSFNNGDAPGESNNPLDWEDTSQVRYMNGMFYGAESFNQDIGDWDVQQVENMDQMFYNASRFNQDLSSWKVPLITSKHYTFDFGSHPDFQRVTSKHPQWGIS